MTRRDVAAWFVIALCTVPFWLLIMIGATQLPECESDDGSGPGVACIWHADQSGDGNGQSFWIDENGETHYF